MMNNLKTFSLSYFLGRAFFLGFGFSLLAKLLDKDAWIACLLGMLFGSMIIFLFQTAKDKLKGNFNDTKSWTKWPLKILFFLFNLFIYSQIVFIFQTFASSFFLIKSPVFFIVLPIPFIIYRICKSGFTTIAKVAEVLMPISLFLFLFGILGLTQNFKLDYFTPVLTHSPQDILSGSLFFAFYSTAPFLLMLNIPTEKNKFVFKYLMTCLSILLLCFFIIGILGPNLMQVYRYPEYMTLKKLRVFNFIEKVENIISIAWLFDSFVTLSVTGNNLKLSLPKKHQNIYFIILLVILYGWSILSSIYYQEGLIVYHVLPIILGVFEVFLLALLLIPKWKKSPKL